MAKDKETEENKANKEEKAKVVKKTAKKKVTKKAAKKVAKKKVAKKTPVRKKITEKKPIKLKEESKDLDSFAVHAAESAENNDAEVVKQPEAPKPETAKTTEKPAPVAEPVISKPETPLATKAKPVTTEPYLKRPANPGKTSADKGEGGLFRLIFVVLLFAGVAYYIDDLYDENQANADKTPVATNTVSEPLNTEASASPAPEVITELKPLETASAQAIAPVQAEQPPEPAAVETKEPVATPAVPLAEAIAQAPEPAQAENLPVEIEAPKAEAQPNFVFPPPPRPEFLMNTAAPQQLPEDQMQLIMQTFGPVAD